MTGVQTCALPIWVADVAFEEQFQAGKLHLLPGGDGGDPNGEASTQAGEHDFTGSRRGVLTKQVQRLVYYDWGVISHVAEGAVLALGDGMNPIGAARRWIQTTLLGECEKTIPINRTKMSSDGLRGFDRGAHGGRGVGRKNGR